MNNFLNSMVLEVAKCGRIAHKWQKHNGLDYTYHPVSVSYQVLLRLGINMKKELFMMLAEPFKNEESLIKVQNAPPNKYS